MIYSIPVFYLESLAHPFISLVSLAIAYEMAENSAFGRRLAAFICCSKLYDGDNFWNSVCDVLSCVGGWLLMINVKMSTLYEPDEVLAK